MGTSAIGNLSSSYVQQALAGALQGSGITASSTSSRSDSSQLSPFAQLASTLQQLQQSNPTKYKQVTGQVAANLQSAAQTAQSQGDSTAAGQLTRLASDFASASQSGQLPNLQDLSQAVGGGAGGSGGHHHHRHVSSGSSPADSTTTTLSQLLSSLQQTGDSQNTQDASINPGAIILQTLSNAGISTSNS